MLGAWWRVQRNATSHTAMAGEERVLGVWVEGGGWTLEGGVGMGLG